MKVLFGSDIHGSSEGGQKLLDAVKIEQADSLILCGDIYYHGPRNPLPSGHSPMELAKILNENKEIIKCVRGNCDSEVDEMISEFIFESHLQLEINGKKIFATHGHKYDKDTPPPLPFDIMIYGHYHVGFIEKKEGKIFASPGSVSLPKKDSSAAYLILTENQLILKDIDGNIIDKVFVK